MIGTTPALPFEPLPPKRYPTREALGLPVETPATEATAVPDAPDEFESDIPLDIAIRAHSGTSWTPDERGHQVRRSYAETLRRDRQHFETLAAKHGTESELESAWAQYRAGYREVTLRVLTCQCGVVSPYIAGPSKFPGRRMEKRSNRLDARIRESVEWRARAMKGISTLLVPETRAILTACPDAVELLRAKIAKLTEEADRMVAINATIRREARNGPEAQVAALVALGYTEKLARSALERDPLGNQGVPAFEITNRRAEIRRLQKRVESVSAAQAREPTVEEGNGIQMEHVPADNRVLLVYPGKPDEATRAALKAAGFRWAPSKGAWSAYPTHRALAFARSAITTPTEST